MTAETLSIGIVQCALGGGREENATRVLDLVREAAKLGARLVVTPELLEGPYFCREEKDTFFEWARPVEGNVTLARFQALAKELGVVLPFSFFEKAGNAYYNTLAMVDADGALLGTYRKSHIPDGPGYEEKFYFRPGDTGFRVFETKAGKVGGAVCWDQWYPECARALALLGADVLVYPTAIGSEPANPALDTRDRWRRAMVGHAVSNVIPVAAANRIGE
nr:N-carbamoylputrescine amidase [Thermoanaerobaculia bacterium]